MKSIVDTYLDFLKSRDCKLQTIVNPDGGCVKACYLHEEAGKWDGWIGCSKIIAYDENHILFEDLHGEKKAISKNFLSIIYFKDEFGNEWIPAYLAAKEADEIGSGCPTAAAGNGRNGSL